MKISDRLYVPGFIQARKSPFILQVGDGMRIGSDANRKSLALNQLSVQ
jgi:hypothetical protein